MDMTNSALACGGGERTCAPADIEVRAIDRGIFVTADGRVFSTRRGGWHEISQRCRGPYRAVSIRRGSDRKRIVLDVHRAVIVAFRGPPPFPGAQCRHLDGDPSNNRLSNLCWGSARDNAEDTIRHGRSGRGQANVNARLTEAQVHDIRARYDRGEQPAIIARYYPVDPSLLGLIGRRKSWTWLPERDPRRGSVLRKGRLTRSSITALSSALKGSGR